MSRVFHDIKVGLDEELQEKLEASSELDVQLIKRVLCAPTCFFWQLDRGAVFQFPQLQ